MAEEGSESARQAPVFYEGVSPDGKYAGANEKCRPRSPGNEIPPTARVDSGNCRLYPHERSFATAVSLGTVLSAIADLTGHGRRDIIGPEKRVHDLYFGMNICYT